MHTYRYTHLIFSRAPHISRPSPFSALRAMQSDDLFFVPTVPIGVHEHHRMDFSIVASEVGRLPVATNPARPSWPTTVAAKDQAAAMVGTLLRLVPAGDGTEPRYAVVSGTVETGRERMQVWGDSIECLAPESLDSQVEAAILSIMTIEGVHEGRSIPSRIGELQFEAAVDGSKLVVRLAVRGNAPTASMRPAQEVLAGGYVKKAIDSCWVPWQPRSGQPLPIQLGVWMTGVDGWDVALEFLRGLNVLSAQEMQPELQVLSQADSASILQLVAELARQPGRISRLTDAFRTPSGTAPNPIAFSAVTLAIRLVAVLSERRRLDLMEEWLGWSEIHGPSPASMARTLLNIVDYDEVDLLDFQDSAVAVEAEVAAPTLPLQIGVVGVAAVPVVAMGANSLLGLPMAYAQPAPPTAADGEEPLQGSAGGAAVADPTAVTARPEVDEGQTRDRTPGFNTPLHRASPLGGLMGFRRASDPRVADSRVAALRAGSPLGRSRSPSPGPPILDGTPAVRAVLAQPVGAIGAPAAGTWAAATGTPPSGGVHAVTPGAAATTGASPASSVPASRGVSPGPATALGAGAPGPVVAPVVGAAAQSRIRTADRNWDEVPELACVFRFLGFAGTPAALVAALGGASFAQDLYSIAQSAGVGSITLASIPQVVSVNQDIVSIIQHVDSAHARSSASVEWVHDWPALRMHLLDAPVDARAAQERLLAMSSLVTYVSTLPAASLHVPRRSPSAELSQVELAARRLARTTEISSIEDGTDSASWAASREMLDPLTSEAAVNQIFEVNEGLDSGVSVTDAVKAIISMPTFGRSAEAAIFSSFKAPKTSGKLDRIPLALTHRRAALVTEVERRIREHVGVSRAGVDRAAEVRLLATSLMLARLLPVAALVRMLGGDPPIDRSRESGQPDTFLQVTYDASGTPVLRPVSEEDRGTWGDPEDKRDAERALIFLESMLWFIFHDAAGLESMEEFYDRTGRPRPDSTLMVSGDAPLHFGLVKGLRFQIKKRVPLSQIYATIEYAAKQMSDRRWERRTQAGAGAGSWAAELAMMFDVTQLQAITLQQQRVPGQQAVQSVQTTNPFAAVTAATFLPSNSGQLGSSVVGAAGTSSGGGISAGSAQHVARTGRKGAVVMGADGMTDWERQVHAGLMAADKNMQYATAFSRVRTMSDEDLKAAATRDSKRKKSPKKDAAAPAAAAPAAAAVAQPQIAQPSFAPPLPLPQWPPMHGYTPQTLQFPPPFMPSLPPPGLVPQPLPQPPSVPMHQLPPPVSGQAGAEDIYKTSATAADRALPEMEKQAKIVAAVNAGKVLADKTDIVRYFDNCAAAKNVPTRGCGWRAIFNPGHVNCTGERRCRCPARAYDAGGLPTSDNTIALEVKLKCAVDFQRMFVG